MTPFFPVHEMFSLRLRSQLLFSSASVFVGEVKNLKRGKDIVLWRGKMRKLNLVDIAIILLLAISSVYVWNRDIAISPEQMPTVVNGLVSSISVVIGFTGALVIFTMSKDRGKLGLSTFRSFLYIAGIGASLSLFWSLYNYVMDGNFTLAFRIAMVSLDIAAAVLVDFIYYHMIISMFNENK